VSKKKKDKEAGQLAKVVAAAAKTEGVSKEELKFIKNLQTAAKKGGNVTKKELDVIKREVTKQSTDKNKTVAKSAKSNPGKYLRSEVKNLSTNVEGETNPPMPETPDIPKQDVVATESDKTPTRNVTDISSLVPQYDAEQIQKILFENISAIELSKVERHDTIEGIDQRYSIISNLSEIRKKYDIIKQLTIMDKFKPLTSIYTINIQDKIPQEDYIRLESLDSTYQYLDEDNQLITREKGYYYIDTNGDLVIELINLERNQQVEVLIDTNGTIYKVES
jgi:hypothetical protein